MKRNRWDVLFGIVAPLLVCTCAFGQFSDVFGKPAEQTRIIAHFAIAGPLAETPVRVPPLFGSEPPQSLKSLLQRLKKARQDPRVAAVVLDVERAQLGLAQLQELHEALRKFEAVDKDVYIHANMLSTVPYALASSASHLSMVPSGDLWILGIYGETPYLRGALDKLGVVPDFEHCGDFKTGMEPLTRSGPSEAGQEQTDWLFDSLYAELVALVGEGRDMKPEKVSMLIDNGPYSAEDALRVGLIDSVKYRQDFIHDLHERFGHDTEIATNYAKEDDLAMPNMDDPFAFFGFLSQLFNPTPKTYDEPSVAIIYVEGVIQTGSAEVSPFGSSSGAYSEDIRRALDRARESESVKAVVLRVDSPGGSALASEIICDAATRLGKKKPLIVSMGNVAASGGYYVSTQAETIFAEPLTITASIGVLGGKLVTTGGWNKLGINWHPTQRGAMAAMMSSSAPFSDAEREKIKTYMNVVYDQFKGRVQQGRGDKLAKPLDEMAGGRVFTGAQAIDLGLVDKLGGLDEAVKHAAASAGLSDYELRVIPEPPTIIDLLMGNQTDEYAESAARATTPLVVSPMLRPLLPQLARMDPMRVSAIVRTLTGLDVMHRERVVMFMPNQWVIR